MEQYLQQMLGRLASAAASDAPAAGSTSTAGRGEEGPAAQIRNSPIGMTALSQVDAVREKPLPPEPVAAPLVEGGQKPQQGGPRTYEQWVAAARAECLSLEEYLVNTLPIDVALAKAITMIGWAETRRSGIDAVTFVNQTVVNRYLYGGASVNGNQYFAIKELLAKVQGFKAGANLGDRDCLLITQLSASFDKTVTANRDLTLTAAHTIGGTEQKPETLLLQWLAGIGYDSPDAKSQATAQQGTTNRFDVSASAGEASATAVAQPYQGKNYRGSTDFDSWHITIKGGEAVMAQEAYRRTVRLLAGIQLGQATFFFPANVYGAQFVDSLGRADAKGNIFERNPDPTLLAAIDATRFAAIPEKYCAVITARGPLVSGVDITAYEWLIIQDLQLSEADKIRILSSMVLQPGVGNDSAILTWSGPFFTVNKALLNKK